jgi:membrane protein required for colicin V production
LRGSGSAVSTDHGGQLVDIGEFFSGIETVDLLIVLYFMAFFVLGFAQGTIRRLLGIGSILFSFFLAANLAEPLADFLGANWTQFPREYSYMVGFLTLFVAGSVSFALVIQGFYKPQPLFAKARFADEIIGGILGLIQAAIIFGCFLVILDSFFLIPGMPEGSGELLFLRDIWTAIDTTKFAELFRETLIPAFFAVTGFLVPDNLEETYPI